MGAFLQRILVFSNILAVISCASLNADQSGVAGTWTNTWGSELINSCNSLSGVYDPKGVERTLGNEAVRVSRLESSIFGIESLEESSNNIVLEQKDNLSLTVSVKDVEGNVLLMRSFDPPHACEEPWVVYESNVEGGGDGSSILLTKTLTRMAKSRNHELIISIQTISISRDWIFFKKKDLVESWYKFSEIQKQK
jgi:hypothetical protein